MVEVYGREICEKSFEEANKFVRFANSLGEKPLLFGGWAVWHYAPYAGSKDVDFVVSDEKLDALIDFLVSQGYGQREARLFKEDIFFDLYSESEEIGDEGKKFALARLYEGAQDVYLKHYSGAAQRVEILLPTLSRLLYSKISALAGRNVAKDRGDVIALLLKAAPEEIGELNVLLSSLSSSSQREKELRERLVTLRNDEASLAIVTNPTRKNLNKLNAALKTLKPKLSS